MQKCFWGFYIILILGILMTGCTSTYKSAVDDRSVEEQYDDQKITMAIRKKFSDDKMIRYFDISTYCYNGNVYLVGEYVTLDQRNQAVRLAEQVEGVKSVMDYFVLTKVGDNCGMRANLKLSANVKTKLTGDKDISSTKIEVNALQCHVILLGIVDSADEIQKAISHAKTVKGIRSVKSFLRTRK